MLTKIYPLWHHKRCFPELHALVHTLKKKKKKKEQAKEVKCGIFWQGRDRLLWAQILQHVKPANKTHKSALQLQRWKQKKLGGSGNLIRGGANVLNLSKVTRYLPPPLRTSSSGNSTLMLPPSSCSSSFPKSFRWKLGSRSTSTSSSAGRLPWKPPETEKVEMWAKTKPEKSMHVEWHLDTKAGIWDFGRDVRVQIHPCDVLRRAQLAQGCWNSFAHGRFTICCWCTKPQLVAV